MWPATGTVTASFGDDSGRWHPGIDIGVLRSLEVRAAMPGHVLAVGEPSGFEGYGNIVQVALGRGYTALYAHLASWRVHVGDAVEAGEPIATAGCTGSCSGTHLHFELRRRGRAVDPMRFHLR
jgi:murein DD-endopeptidase MepM/ murein hydrolase activator NlpD